jgi:hypothetical protein
MGRFRICKMNLSLVAQLHRQLQPLYASSPSISEASLPISPPSQSLSTASSISSSHFSLSPKSRSFRFPLFPALPHSHHLLTAAPTILAILSIYRLVRRLCTSLQSKTLPENIPSLLRCMFVRCSNLSCDSVTNTALPLLLPPIYNIYIIV